ncbi:MAG: DUF3291 domain-containing protein [Pseudomonadota bacterium]
MQSSGKPLAFHLVHCNVATMRGESQQAVMAGFFERLDALNALADRSPGFVWRLDSEEQEILAARIFDNDRLLVNLSVWETLEALEHYVYRTAHADALRQRAAWFEPSARASLALWWVPAGHTPDVEEAKARFDKLWANGPTPDAFGFRRRFDPGGNPL